jgi:hypothetical protein
MPYERISSFRPAGKIRPVTIGRNSGYRDALARRSLIGDDKDGNLMG